MRLAASALMVISALIPSSAEESQPTPHVGSPAPDFRLTKLDGSSIALSELLGKRVLINSWATW
jgi:hypothetical protein